MHSADHANLQMVDALIAEGTLWSPLLIAAFRATPRHRFLDRVFQFQPKQQRWKEVITRDPDTEEVQILYSDQALITRLSKAEGKERPAPISSSSQPSLMSQMLEDLRLQPGLKVLEVGAGTGYNAALIAHVVGPDRLTTIDVDQQVIAEAWDHLRRFPDRRVCLKHADGRLGYPAHAPYDRIIVTASTPDWEPAWLEQLAPGGIVSAPLQLAPGISCIGCGTVVDGVFDGRLIRPAYFMPLRAEHEIGSQEEDTEVPNGDGLRGVPAPWAGLFDQRRPRIGWQRFSQSLTFYAWLRGHTIHFRRGSEQQLMCGIQCPDGPCCWFSPYEWFVKQTEDRAVGWRLWRAFLDAGGPWPTDFRLRASPTGGLSAGNARESYLRQGARCQHLWELLEPRGRPGWL